MFCPRCQQEYRPGFIRCSDCDVALLYRYPTRPAVVEPEDEESGYVIVATAHGALEEGQITSFLEANGIPTQIRGEGFRKVYGITIDGIGAAHIMVPEDLAESATDLLEKADRGELEIKAEDG